MRYLQIVHADHVDRARSSYLEMLSRHGIQLPPMTQIFVEGVYSADEQPNTWLCYYAPPGQQQAA